METVSPQKLTIEQIKEVCMKTDCNDGTVDPTTNNKERVLVAYSILQKLNEFNTSDEVKEYRKKDLSEFIAKMISKPSSNEVDKIEVDEIAKLIKINYTDYKLIL